MFKRFHLVYFLFFVFFTNALSQEIESSTKKSISAGINYDQQELDSISIKIVNEFYKGNYDIVLEKTPELLKNATALGTIELELRFTNILGNTLIKLDDYEGAESIFKEALETAIREKDTVSIVSTYVNLGNTYFKINNEKSLEYYRKGLSYNYQGPKQDILYYMTHNNIAETYLELENTELAIYHLNKAKERENSVELDRQRETFKGISYYIEGVIAIIDDNPTKAIHKINKSLEYKSSYDLSYLVTNYKNLIESHRKLKNYQQINEAYKVYDSIKDINYEKEKIKQLQIARTKVNLDKVKQDLAQIELEQELFKEKESTNKLFLILSIIFTFLLLSVALVLYKEKTKRDKLLKGLTIKNQQYLEASKKAEDLSKSNMRFLSTISHELRTPLYGIIGLSSSFLKEPNLVAFQDDFKSLKFSADYLLALVNDVLNMNKIASNLSIQIKESHFELRLLLENIVKAFNFLNEKNNNQVHLHLDPSIPSILYSDKTKLSQVLMNLMSNASKFTEDGEISIKAKKVNESEKGLNILFEVIDTGRGIHPDDQQHVFEEFKQASQTTNNEITGTGLGIPIVNKLLAVFDSSLQMNSVYGEGTVFFFNLNVQEGKLQNIKVPHRKKDISLIKNKSVLIVDDNRINQLVTQKVLDQYKLNHTTALNGKEAVSLAREKDFDFILMDINMPVMNGIEASKEIRTFNKTTPIIALTATNYENPEKDIYCHGINAIVLKPYNNEDLLNCFLDQLDN